MPLGLGVLAAVALQFLGGTSPLRRLEYWTYDWRVVLRSSPLLDFMQAPTHTRNPDIVVVPIDDETLARIPEPMVFWIPHFAAVVGSLVEGGAAVVALDYLFKVTPEEHLQQAAARVLDEMARERGLAVAPSTAGPLLGGDDMRFFSVLRSGRVVLMDFLREDGTVERGYPRFAWGAGTDNLGLVNMEPDEDGVVRRQFLYRTGIVSGREEALLSFDLVTARRLGKTTVELDGPSGRLRLGSRLLPHDENYRIPVNWVGPPETFRSPYSFADLLDRSHRGEEAFFREQFAGKVVVIGPYFTGIGGADIVRTPYQVTGRLEMYGVEVHANILNTLVNGDFIRPTPPWGGPLVLVVVGLLTALLCFVLRPLSATIAVFAVALTLAAVSCVLLYRLNVWMEVAGPVACIPLSFALVYTFRYVSEERERRHIRALLGRYISEAVAESILRDPSSLELGGARADVSILFCDINDFTPISERSRPEEIVSILNDYFTRMEQVIFRHGATLKQFVGDEIMVICGAPQPDPDHPATACRLALEMVSQLHLWQAEREAAGLDVFHAKFGLHCGEVVVGNVGSPNRTEYAAVGDVVNTASRIMTLTQQAGALLLISEEMRERVDDRFVTRPAGSFSVKGKSGELTVYELVAERAEADAGPEES